MSREKFRDILGTSGRGFVPNKMPLPRILCVLVIPLFILLNMAWLY